MRLPERARGVDSEGRFALLMLALSVLIFVALRRSERSSR
jgi:hypothetical protein